MSREDAKSSLHRRCRKLFREMPLSENPLLLPFQAQVHLPLLMEASDSCLGHLILPHCQAMVKYSLVTWISSSSLCTQVMHSNKTISALQVIGHVLYFFFPSVWVGKNDIVGWCSGTGVLGLNPISITKYLQILGTFLISLGLNFIIWGTEMIVELDSQDYCGI